MPAGEVRGRFGRGTELAGLAPETPERRLRHEEHRDRLELRRHYGRVLLGVLVAQVLVVHGVFVWFGYKNAWEVSSSVFIAYLTTTLGETVGLAAIVVRYLFPNAGG